MRDRYRIVQSWLGTIERAIARGDGEAAGRLTREYVRRCRELGLLGWTRERTRDDAPPYERPNDGEVPITLPVVTSRWEKEGWKP